MVSAVKQASMRVCQIPECAVKINHSCEAHEPWEHEEMKKHISVVCCPDPEGPQLQRLFLRELLQFPQAQRTPFPGSLGMESTPTLCSRCVPERLMEIGFLTNLIAGEMYEGRGLTPDSGQ